MRKMTISWVLILGLIGVFQPARADFRSGSCLLSMHFTFSPPLRFAQADPGAKTWTMNYTSVPPVNCVVSPTQVGDALIRTSWGNVFGSAVTGSGLDWTCGLLLGDTIWNQNFAPFMPVPPSSATLVMSLGQGATIVISSNTSSFQGVIVVASVPPVTQCSGAGVSSLNATGVMVFHDPELPQ